jgi:hypothetical protein
METSSDEKVIVRRKKKEVQRDLHTNLRKFSSSLSVMNGIG